MSVETEWEIPEPTSVCEVRLDDQSITTVRQHGNPSGLRLILSHGNGLAIDLYYPFWSLLTDDFDLMVYDLRNHGWNRVGCRREHNIPTLIHDHDLILENIDRRYGSKPTVGVYHSLSTLVTILADKTVASERSRRSLKQVRRMSASGPCRTSSGQRENRQFRP